MEIQVFEVIWVGFPGGSAIKELSYQYRRVRSCGFEPWIEKIPQGRKWYTAPVFFPGKFHGQMSHGVAKSRT